MKVLLAVILLCIAGAVNAQTIEEQIELKALEIRTLCQQANPGIVKCYTFVDQAVCPDPLAATRAQLQAASQTINQVLTENPAP